jgi:hypothetical protein
MTVRMTLLVAGLTLFAGPLQAQKAPPAIAMEDQFERPHDVADLRGDVVVLVYGDRKSADANKKLGENLHVTFHPTAKGLAPAEAQKAPVRPLADQPAGAKSVDVHAVAVASVGKVPALVRVVIRKSIRGGSPDVPVWLDFDDQLKRQFGLVAGVPNVVVLDRNGYARYVASGELTAEQMKKLVDSIEGLRAEPTRAAGK